MPAYASSGLSVVRFLSNLQGGCDTREKPNWADELMTVYGTELTIRDVKASVSIGGLKQTPSKP